MLFAVVGSSLAQDRTVLYHHKISSTEGGFAGVLDDGDLFGEWVAGMGDYNDDGVPDALVCALLDDDGDTDAGALWILCLNPDGTVLIAYKISALEGNFAGDLAANDWFGLDPCAIGDFNGDGMVDLAAGAPGDDDGGDDRGAVCILVMNPGIVRVDDPEDEDVPESDQTPVMVSRVIAGVPNPFNPKTTIHYSLARAGDGRIRIFDVAGNLVRAFDLSDQPAGENTLEWNGRDERGETLADGVYLVQLETSVTTDGIRVTLIK